MERDVPGEEPGSFDEPGQVSAETSGDAAEPDEWTVEDFDQFESFDAADDQFGEVVAAAPEATDEDPAPPAPEEPADVEQPSLELGFGEEVPPPPPADVEESEPQAPASIIPDESDWSAVDADADSTDDFAALWQDTDDDESVPAPEAWDTLRPADQLQEIPIIVPPAPDPDPDPDPGPRRPPDPGVRPPT